MSTFDVILVAAILSPPLCLLLGAICWRLRDRYRKRHATPHPNIP
jgi:hypothetical protein